MKKYDCELMVQELGMKFDEAVELFSDETLESMMMVNIVGGQTNYGCNSTNNGCSIQNGCDPSGSNSGGSSGGNNSGSNNSGSNNSGHGNSNTIIVQWGAAGCQVGWRCGDFTI